jgi:hypothetical protein
MIVLAAVFYEYTWRVGCLMIASDVLLVIFHIALGLLILFYSSPASRFKGDINFWIYVGTSSLVLSLYLGVLLWNIFMIIDSYGSSMIFYIIQEFIFIALAAHYVVFFFIYFRYYKLTRVICLLIYYLFSFLLLHNQLMSLMGSHSHILLLLNKFNILNLLHNKFHSNIKLPK